LPHPIDFQWDDPFLLDEHLAEDERTIRDTARTCAQNKVAAPRQSLMC
jgi:glutaryl-CoA dehydrogenase